MAISKDTIQRIEKALTLHLNYRMRLDAKGINEPKPRGSYLNTMDMLAWHYSGSKSQKVSKLLDEYYKAVNVVDLDAAIERLIFINHKK